MGICPRVEARDSGTETSDTYVGVGPRSGAMLGLCLVAVG